MTTISDPTTSPKRNRALLVLLLLCSSLILCAIFWTNAGEANKSTFPLAPASNITVNSTAQSPGAVGDCTLGEAIVAANTDLPVDGCSAGSGQDTIILPAGTYTLSNVDNDDHSFVGATGLPLINSDVIIQGAGAGTTIIERDPNAVLPFRLMAIKDQNIGSLIINDVTMRGGVARFGDNGGALFTFGRPTTLNNVEFINNSSVQGGAVAAGSIEINHCTFTNNHADASGSQAGAIFASRLTIRNSTFTGNTAEHGGGAILTPGHQAQTYITDSTFLNNSAMNEGGALVSYGTVTILRTTFDSNSTTATAGALSVSGNVVINESVVINNHATSDVGGILNGSITGTANVLSINHCNISNNTSNRFSGGIEIDGTTASISNTTISGNHAVNGGGGIYDRGSLTLTNVTVEGNFAGNAGTSGDGGGIYVEGSGTSTFNNVTISGNQATRFGAGLFHHSSDLLLKNTIIALNNNGDTSGVDVYQNSVPLTSLGYNLIGIKDGANFTNAVGDQTGVSASPINPQLGPLQNNGGPTLTRALLSGSPANDAANPAAPGSGGNSCAPTDQRGRRRPDGIVNSSGRCDIGAFEVASPAVCTTPPAGMVAWWPFDGNGDDIQGGHTVSLFGNPSFGTGKVAQSLSFDGLDDHAQVTASSAIDVGSGNGLTLDAWIKPADNLTAQPVIEWNDGGAFVGVQLWISADFAGFGQGPGSLFVNLEDSDGVFHVISTGPGLLAANAWQHVAVTYDKISGVAAIYLNGEIVAQQVLGTFTPRTSTDLYFGYRAVGVEAGRRFNGDMDEVEILNRALNATEIQTIYDADSAGKCRPAPALPTISISDISQNEGNTGATPFTFTVSLSNPSSQIVTVHYATADGSATIANNDYIATSGTVTFNPGETSQPIVVMVNGDTNLESNEVFRVNLSAATQATIADSQAFGTILNDDSPPTITIDDVSQAEGNSGVSTFTFTVSLSGSSFQTITVNYGTANGTATTADNDYSVTSGTLTFNPGQTSKPIAVSVNGDTRFEPDERFVVKLFNAANATFLDQTGEGFILNDDPPPSANGEIAFATNRDGNNEIYVMNPDGSAQTRLTNNPASDKEPVWSRDGANLLFTSNRDGNSEIYKMSSDGSGQTRLTANASEDFESSWSPDGNQIVFVSARDGNFEIYRMNADGSNPTRLTNSSSDDFDPVWSPDGQHIAFVSGRDGNLEIYLMNPDGSNQVRITTTDAHNFEPVWSPDGARIAFTRSQEFVFNVEVYVMNADGSNQTRLTATLTDDFNPAWSPDGTRLVFTSSRDGNNQLYLMNPDGSNQARLTNNGIDDFDPNWQANFLIKGQVRDAGNNGISGITMTLSGSRSAVTNTDATGNYSFGVQAGGSYTVTPSKTGYDFIPVNQTFNNISENQTANFTASSIADLSLTVSDSPDPVTVQGNVTYTFTISNHGPLTASGVVFTQTFAANMSFVSINPSQGSCSRAGATLTCQLGTLNNSATSTVTTVLTAPNTITTVSTTASVTGNELDPTPANNQVQENTSVRTVTDLSLTETAAATAGFAGDNLSYEVKVHNNGPNPAHSVVITGTTAGLGSVTVNLSGATGSCSASAQTFTCTLNNFLVNGGNATVAIQGVITATGISLTNSAQVNEDDIDSNPGNDSANVNTTVYQVPHTGTAFLTVKSVVDSTGDPAPRHAGDFLFRVVDGSNVDAFFPGSESGTQVGLSVAAANTVFTVEETNPISTYLTTFQCDGNRSALNVNQVKLSVGDSRLCTVTNTYIGSRNAGGQANAMIRVIKTVDNTGAPSPKLPGDFQIDVKLGNVTLDASPGSSIGVKVGVNALPAGSDLKVVEEPGHSDYIVAFTGDCTKTGDLFALQPNQIKVCTVHNLYVGTHGPNQDAILNVIKQVDNFNASPSERRVPGDFQLSIHDFHGTYATTFPGSDTGNRVPVPSDLLTITEGAHARFVPTYSGDCTGKFDQGAQLTLLPSDIKNCTVTNRYVANNDDQGLADRVLKIQLLVDSTGDSAVKPSNDYLLGLDTHPSTGVVHHISPTAASATGTYFGLKGSFACSAFGGIACTLLNDFDLVVTDLKANPHYVITSLEGACGATSNSRIATVAPGEFGLCKIRTKFVQYNLGQGYFNNFVQLVDNAGAPTNKQPSDFTVVVQSGSQTKQFPGSSAGTLFSLDVSRPFFADTLAVSGYLRTSSGSCSSRAALFQQAGTCTLTSSYVGTRRIAGANSIVKVISIVDNTGAPTPKSPSDFQLTVNNGATQVATFNGSSQGINVGVSSDIGNFTVSQLSGPANYQTHFSGDCSHSIAAREIRVCTVTNTYIASPVTTPAGTNVSVQSGNVNIGFANVSTAGATSTTQIAPAAVGTLPGTFKIADSLAFEITTTATVSAPIHVCFNVTTGTAPTLSEFNALKVMHAENGQLVDRTISRDFTTRTICAQTDSLSPFAVLEQINDSLPAITGRVTDQNGDGISGLKVNLSGTLEQTDTTDGLGNYAFVNLTPGEYTVAPNGAGYSTSPSYVLFNNLNADETANFSAANNQTVKFDPALDDSLESNGVATITVIRPTGADGQVTVDYTTNDLTAQAGLDYVATSGTLTFATGVTARTIEVPIINNSSREGNRSFILTLTNPSAGLSVAVPNPAIVTIIDDEETASTSIGVGKTVVLGDVTVTYANVTIDGLTNVALIDPTSAGPAPLGYTITGPGYDISTSAIYSAPVNVCFNLPSISDPTTFSHLKILHGELNAGNQLVLVDRTTGQNFASRTVCSSVSSLSPFVIAQSLAPNTALVTISGQLTTLSGVPISGVNMNLSGSQSGFAVSDSEGRYSFPNLTTGVTYAVTPSLANYSFAPASQTFSLFTNKLDASFTAIPNNVPSANPLDTASFFVRQHYLDFLGREPDSGGLAFWTDQIAQCGTNASCLKSKRVDVSNAFFFEQEYQQTGAYVFRIYRASFGNTQPIPNPDPSTPGEAAKLPAYAVFAPDRAQVVDGANLASSQLAFANAFVLRPQFLARYPNSLSGPEFVDAVLATISNDTGANLSSQRTALIDLFNSGGRGNVIYRLADDNVTTNPINNRAFIDAEYNRGFVFTEYSGYLRRDADIGGFLFWLGQINSGPLRDTSKQHAMVCSFITSAEYQLRFSPVVTRGNSECGP